MDDEAKIGTAVGLIFLSSHLFILAPVSIARPYRMHPAPSRIDYIYTLRVGRLYVSMNCIHFYSCVSSICNH